MKYASIILLGSALIASSCNSFSKDKKEESKEQKTETGVATNAKDFTTSESGLDYKKVIAGTGATTGKPGDYGEMHVVFKIGDSVMINTYEMNEHMPVQQQFSAPTINGDLMEGLMSMKAGDSTVFRMLMDTLAVRANQPKPSWAKTGDYATWEVKMVSVKTKEQLEVETANKDKAQMAIDDKLIQEYFKAKGIKNAKKDASGLYYVVHKQGAGAMPQAGQKVTVNYTGQNLKGEKFDSNVDPAFSHVEPFSFDLGKSSVIKGWDKGVALMNKGMKATFYLPSSLGYGERGAGEKIPPNAILVFDIELLSFN